MKKLLILTVAIFIIQSTINNRQSSIKAQSPEKMSYQAVIRDAGNNLVKNTEVGMQISVLQDSTGGIAVYVETQKTTTNVNGLVSMEIGVGTIVSGAFSAIDWSQGPYFIKTETDPSGGENYSITGTSQLLSIPYALHAKTAETATNVAISGNEAAFDGWDTDTIDDFDGQYSSLTGAPIIPTKTSELTNDAAYLTSEIDGSITNELQTLSISNDTIYLTNGDFIKLPAGFSGNYSDLTNTPTLTGDVSGDINNNTVSKISGRNLSSNIPSNGQVLKWNSASQTWEPNEDNLGAAGTTDGVVTSVSVTGDDTKTITLLRSNGMDSVAAIFTDKTADADADSTNELQTLSISNDTIYLTNGDFVKLPASSSFTGSYNDLTDVPANMDTDNTDDFNGQYSTLTGKPTIPTKASELTNDAGYSITDTTLTEAEVDAYVANNGYLTSEVDGSTTNELQTLSISNDTIYLTNGDFVKLPAYSSFTGSYNDLTDVPANIDTDNTDDFNGQYSTLTGKPTIPTKASELTNDAGYSTTDTTLTEAEVDAYVSNNGYLTTFTEVDGSTTNELQTLSISNDTIYLSDGSFAKLPTGFTGSYNDLTDVPANIDTDATNDFDGSYSNLTGTPTIPTKTSDLTNDAGYLSTDTTLTEAEVDNFVSNNGFVTSPNDADADTTNEIQNLAEVITINNSANAQIKNVTDPTEAQDAATKAYVDLLESRIEVLELVSMKPTDYDGNTYEIVKIGSQIWMAENLKTTHYSDGTSLVDGSGAGDITSDYTTKYYFWYSNDSATNAATYGALYTWAAAMNGAVSSSTNPSNIQGVCPTGWHLPSHDEWTDLERAICASGSCATDFPYDVSTSGWCGTDESSRLASNSSLWTDGALETEADFGTSGFNVLPSGYRYFTGSTLNKGNRVYFWSATELNSTEVWYRYLNFNASKIARGYNSKSYGLPIRCVKN